MSTKKQTTEPRIFKEIPTIFPSGFGVIRVEDDDIIIIEFLDRVNNESSDLSVIGSFALTSKKVRELIENLTDVKD